MKSNLYEFRVRRIRRSFAFDGDAAEELTGPAEVAAVFRYLARDDPRELFMALSVDARNRALGVEIVHIGWAMGVDVHPREVFRAAILAGAASLIVGHNHPSGVAEPSPADLELSERLRKCGDLLGLPLIDHVIVAGEKDFYSLAHNGWKR